LNLLDVCDEVLRSHTPDLEKRKAFFNTLLEYGSALKDLHVRSVPRKSLPNARFGTNLSPA